MSGDRDDDESGHGRRESESGGPTPPRIARAYYRALDSHDYEELATLLAPEFVHDRPDMRLEGRDRFVEFMREERPNSDTTHELDGVYVASGGAESNGGERSETGTGVVVRGRLLDADGERIVAFADAFTLADGRATRVETYTR